MDDRPELTDAEKVATARAVLQEIDDTLPKVFRMMQRTKEQEDFKLIWDWWCAVAPKVDGWLRDGRPF